MRGGREWTVCMTVTVREALERSVLAQADPVVEAADASLGNAVRWAYTNERYDVARFLCGGELVIVEGSALFAHLDDAELARYVDSLADIGAAGIVVELVEGLREVPPALLERACRRALPVIGLRARIPFVDACQSVNTLIVKDQFLVQMEVDALSTVLRRELAQAHDVGQVGACLARICGESVAIFDADGLPVAFAGPRIHSGDEPTVLIAVERQGVPIATLEISQRVRLFDERTRTQIAQVVSQVMAALMPWDVSVSMTARILSGPADGVHADARQAADVAQMLGALGAGGEMAYYPFAMGMRSLVASAAGMERLLSGFAAIDGARTLCLLEGGVLFGVVGVPCAAKTSGDTDIVRTDAAACVGDPAALAVTCARILADVVADGGDVWAIGGRASLEAGMLADVIGVMRATIHDAAPPWGTMRTVYDGLLARFAHVAQTGTALAMLLGVMLGESLKDDDVALTTLAACFAAGDNRTRACASLGIRRQTLYNRLDKVQRRSGITPDDGVAWSLLLFAAQLALSTRDGQTSAGTQSAWVGADRC